MSELQQTLSDLHRELADAQRLDPAERAMLEAAVAAIQSALAQPQVLAPDIEPGTPADSLEGAAVRLEADHPGLAGAVRAIVDALGKAGI